MTIDNGDQLKATALLDALRIAAKERSRPDGSSYRALLYADEERIAGATGCSHREVQITALQNDIVPERYARNQQSIPGSEQLRLLESHVAIIGLGGLGGAVTEILARIGIGSLTLVDGDRFEDSNLNRQLLSSSDVLGQMKAEVAARRVELLNPAVEIHKIPQFFSADTGAEILEGVDICVDCLDTITDRFMLEKSCKAANIPLVSAAIAGTSGQVTVIFPDDPGLRRIYGSPDKAPKKGIETTLGTLPFAAIAMAALECAEVVALAAGRPAQLRNKLLLADFAYHSMDTVEFE